LILMLFKPGVWPLLCLWLEDVLWPNI